MKLLNLFIDESGSANPKVKESDCYILSGCVVNDWSRTELKILADQIKFKYWGKTDIIFHSREIGRKSKDFVILKDEKINKEFQRDLFHFLSFGGYQLFIIVVDSKKIAKRNWNSSKVYKETALIIVKNFLLSFLAARHCKGRLVVESATSEKDFFFHKAASFYLSNGLKELHINYSEVQDVLTEISFVTKKNFDIEEQIADMLAYGAKLKFLKKKISKMDEYEKGILKILENKLFVMQPNTGRKKKKFYSRIESFKILP